MTRLLLLLGCAALVLGACGDDDEPVATDDNGSPPPGSFEPAGEYLSEEVTERGAARPLVDGTRIALRFDDGVLGADAGCNSLSGDYRLEGDVLRVGQMGGTEMGCDPERHDQDRWLTELLTAGPRLEPAEDGFVLTSGDTAIRFVDREVADPDQPLVGTKWVVTGFIDGDVAMSTSGPGDPGQLVFEDNGLVTGHDGCNGFGYGSSPGEEPEGLAYRVEGGSITFEGGAVTTDMACPDREDDVERYHAVLRGTVEFEIEGTQLTLVAGDGRGVTFTAAG